MPDSKDKNNNYSSIADEEGESKFWRKSRENPFVPIGMAGGLAALLFSAYKFRNRGTQKVSVYLIHTRVAAQGIVVTAVTIGLLYPVIYELWYGKKK